MEKSNLFSILVGCLLLLSTAGLFLVKTSRDREKTLLSPGGEAVQTTPKPLLEYTFARLSTRTYQGSQIKLERIIDDKNPDFTSYLFTFTSDGKKVSGMANIPKTADNKKLPVIVMVRGYCDRATYYPGLGTMRSGQEFAENGYITLAPDFLGYGESDMPENDVWWERFNNPVIVLNLLESIKTLPQANPEKVGFWAHSNGGQITLSVLEISGKPIPTTLWAPVSKPFPYSVLYFTDEFEDEGKALRAEVSRLEKDYDVKDYSINRYFDRIKAPMHLHQGTADEAVPVAWSNLLAKQLEKLEVDIEYYVYPGADHNMSPAWPTAIARDIAFFNEKLK